MPRTRVDVAVAGHVTEVSGPVQALGRYLKQRNCRFAFARHPFSYTSMVTSECDLFDGSVSIGRRTMTAPRCVAWLRDCLANLLWFGSMHSKVFIGIDNLNAFCGLVLRLLGRTDAVIYYVIDYTPRRFTSPIINMLYHIIDFIAVRFCDETWNISDRIAAVRRKQGLPESKNRVVGVGVDLSLISNDVAIRDKQRLVIVSHLTESKGVQLAIRAMRALTAEIPGARLSIVGVGPYEKELRRLVAELDLTDVVEFKGLMNHQELFTYLPTCGIALAPYLDDKNSITYFADPTKPKEYLAAGLPVVITDVPWIAELIKTKPMGVMISYSEDDFIQAAKRLLSDETFYDLCVANARLFASILSWSVIYDEAAEGGVLQKAL